MTKEQSIKGGNAKVGNEKVAIIMGSSSDWPVMSQAREALLSFGIGSQVQVVSAHRTPEGMLAFARGAHTAGIGLIIAGAGGAAHLPGMVAAASIVPVIGVPIVSHSSPLQGVDALLSIVQMPSGVPVATVGINAAFNAGILAAQLLAQHDPSLQAKLQAYKQGLEEKVRQQNETLSRELGH